MTYLFENEGDVSYERIKYYDGEAKKYDTNRFNCDCNRIYDKIQKEIVYDYLRNCEYVLDAGTGTGRFAIYLAKKGIEVVAIDSSRGMISIAREKSKREGCENKIQFIVGDIEHLPFKTEVFEGICSIFVLIHFTSRNQIISEFSRIIKERGVVVFDVPNKILSRGYWMIMGVFGKTTFRDYHYDLGDIQNLFLTNSMKVVDRQCFVKMPRLIIHFFICVLRLTFLVKGVEKLERYNFGATSIIRGIKINEDTTDNASVHSQ